ncbi:Deformed Epidermal Autoregulatory Factor 1-like [Manis pentadactyla]|nr:Deformed Epidermal Autoregulatory Factor 1-like [Manis pentadactyla]
MLLTSSGCPGPPHWTELPATSSAVTGQSWVNTWRLGSCAGRTHLDQWKKTLTFGARPNGFLVLGLC